MSEKNIVIQSGNEQIEIEQKELICWDCQKKLRKGEEFAHYQKNGINYFKCSDCHKKEKSLHNYQKAEVYSRIVGYIRPVEQWNMGKKEEWKNRKTYKV